MDDGILAHAPPRCAAGRQPGESGPYNRRTSSNGRPMHVNASSFKAYDIRGVVGAGIDAEFAEHLGRAFGSAALAAGDRAVAVGRDGRLSGPAF